MCAIAGSDKAKVFIARSAAMADLARVADSAAAGSSCVLILGERGVGKRLFAERLHSKSPRREKPFVRVNCARLEKLPSFELAGGGSLFLDEIGGIPLDMQEALLKALQEKKHEGVRLICSSACDLERSVKEEKFLDALFQRLNVVSFRIPPLRERRDDIMPLAECFLKRFSDETKKNFEGFSDDARTVLLEYSWPGNVRELKNSVERSCVLGNPPFAGAQDLQLPSLCSAKNESQSLEEGFVPQSGLTLKDAVNGFKKFYVEKALRTAGSTQAEVAAALGIQRTYLSRLLLELGIR